jgi:Flp pilus assembly protein TadG
MQSNSLENYGCSKMLKQNSANKRPFRHERAQAIAEFAIALPVLLMVLIGIFEVGRMVFIYAAVNNASREAARYASAYGLGGNGIEKYRDCAGIQETATRSAYFAKITSVTIEYWHPQKDANGNDVVTSGVLSESILYSACSSSVNVASGDRVKVTVTAPYKPIITLIPLRQRIFQTSSTRTILGIFKLD